jgi:hypothetical protein
MATRWRGSRFRNQSANVWAVTLAEWLGVAGFALSVVALVINVALTWIKWPRIRVEAMQVVGGQYEEVFILRVINNGSEAITIRSIGWCSDGDPRLVDYETPVTNPGVNYVQPQGAELPARIEGHGVAVWHYRPEALTPVNLGTLVRAYALRYKTFRWRFPTGRRQTPPMATAVSEEQVLRQPQI